MIFKEGLRAAWMGITGNFLRSALTTLGIVIGVAAVIALIGVGQGAQAEVMGEIGRLGSEAIMVSARGGHQLSAEDADMLVERVPSLSRAAPLLSTGIKVRWGSRDYDTSVEGAGAAYPHIIGSEVKRGRFFDEEDIQNANRVAVVGQKVLDELFAGRDALGEQVQINGQNYTVVGILRPEGAYMGQDRDDLIMVPISSLQRTLRTDRVGMLYAQGADPETVDLATAHMGRVFEAVTGREDSVRITSQSQILDIVNAITGTFTIMLGAIAGISLVVGGIGIMNIMLVSVKERTREIGIRKAVGAKRRDILMQFLIESVALSLGGGIFGILLGSILTTIIQYLGLTAIVTPASVALACGFSAFVGLASGVYPAMQAASLDPIESLRYE